MQKCKTLVTLLLMLALVISIDSNVDEAMANSSLQLDLFTQKAPYDGKGLNQPSDAFSRFEEVFLYANVKYNGQPIPNMLVVYDVNGPENFQYVAVGETNSTGIALFSFRIPENDFSAFGEWIVLGKAQLDETTTEDTICFQVGWIINIVSVTTIDEKLQPKNTFSAGNNLGVNVLIENIGIAPRNITIVAVAKDQINVILDSVELDHLETTFGQINLQFSLHIPNDAKIGIATLHLSALTAPAKQGGIPYCPETKTLFQLVLHDVAVLSVIPSQKSFEAGQVIEIRVNVSNEGSESETFNVSIYCNELLIDTFSNFSLLSYTKSQLVFLWNTKSLQNGTHVIGATASSLLEELHTLNNHAETTVTILPYIFKKDKVFDISLTFPFEFYCLSIVIFAIIAIILLAILHNMRSHKENKESFERAWKTWYSDLTRDVRRQAMHLHRNHRQSSFYDHLEDKQV